MLLLIIDRQLTDEIIIADKYSLHFVVINECVIYLQEFRKLKYPTRGSRFRENMQKTFFKN